MQPIDKKYFTDYKNSIGEQIDLLIKTDDLAEQQFDLHYKIQACAVYSSNIEGNSIDLNSFMNYKLSEKHFKPQKEIQEIEDLICAYEYAQASELNEVNFLYCHKLLAKLLLPKEKIGKYRKDKVGVFGQFGLVYLAVEAEYVKVEMKKFFHSIKELLNKELSPVLVFYHASLIHLKFMHIHPFADGNGRAARLLEKWFIAQKLDANFWKLASEKYYKDHQEEYYKNLNLGVNYYELNYDKCLPFLLMLPQSIKTTIG